MLKMLVKQLLRQKRRAHARKPLGPIALAGAAMDLSAWLELDAEALTACAGALIELGDDLVRRGRPAEALQLFHRAATADRPPLQVLRRLCGLLEQVGDLDAAEEHGRRALALFPKDPELLLAHANVLADLGHWAASRARYDEALAVEPESAAVHFNRAVLLMETGRFSEAIAGYEKVISLQPGFVDARLNSALVRLASGELDRGWKEYEVRFHPGLGTNAAKRRALHVPEWSGEDLTDKRILVHGEQGIGDQIVFASMYPDLMARTADCVFECSRKLVPLFAHSFPRATVVPIADPPDVRTSRDVHWRIAAGSLARWLRPDISAFASSGTYLSAVQERVEHWRHRLNEALGARLKIGICWRSSNTTGSRALACTDLTQWSSVFGVKEVCFVNLQYDECSAELARAQRQFGVRVWCAPGVDLFDDLLETSALMRALDLVITAPTVVGLHAAALGVATWQLTCGLEWQTLGTDHNPWLPALTRYFREAHQSWDEILDRIASDLEQTVTHAGQEGTVSAACRLE